MVVLYFSWNFDVVVWRGEPRLPMSPSWLEAPSSYSHRPNCTPNVFHNWFVFRAPKVHTLHLVVISLKHLLIWTYTPAFYVYIWNPIRMQSLVVQLELFHRFIVKEIINEIQLWPVWLSGLSAGLRTKGLQARSPVGGVQEATTHWCFFPSLSPSLPLSLKINK